MDSYNICYVVVVAELFTSSRLDFLVVLGTPVVFLRLFLLIASIFDNFARNSRPFFNNFFTSVAAKTKESIKYSHKHFSNFLKNRSDDSFFLSPTDKYELINIISSLDPIKSTGPNSIPTKILKLLKNDISAQLSDIFNVSFSAGVFPTILKIGCSYS